MTINDRRNDDSPVKKSEVWNVPNAITMARLVLALVLFVTIPIGLLWTSLVLFVIAASTDWIDGWYARKFDLVTQLGRMLDPFCDKLIICGSFVCLIEATYHMPWWCRVSAPVVVIVIGRELLVTALRSFVESKGGDFSAKMAGKIKMALQCAVVMLALPFAALFPNDAGQQLPLFAMVIMATIIWTMIASTIHSGAGYIVAATKFAGRASTTSSNNSDVPG